MYETECRHVAVQRDTVPFIALKHASDLIRFFLVDGFIRFFLVVDRFYFSGSLTARVK